MQRLQDIVWGVLGAGAVCEKKSMPAMEIIPHSRVKTVMRRDAGACRAFAERHRIPNWTTESEVIFRDPEINAVYIATPPDTHEPYAVRAAKAGKAVYVEKPMARNYGECRNMIKACDEADVPLFVAYYRRRLPHFLHIKELLEAKAIGTVRSVTIRFIRSARPDDIAAAESNWRIRPAVSGGGHFHDLASHQLDLMDYFFGPIRKVKGRAHNIAGYYEPADTVWAEFDFDGGIHGSGEWNFVSPAGEEEDTITVSGDEGELRFSTFAHARIEGTLSSGTALHEEMILPVHIQEPLIRTIVAQLRGEGTCPSNGESAARTSRVMEEICSGK
ncbi:MAG: Gfo/Idh/MocA family oxidoreductase [Candidatus Marinimicrobia bacterium]|nr:Gfo/Idh/MocA family oxidoreductase [Candidatus Neomarinimicrobiota bacterium]